MDTPDQSIEQIGLRLRNVRQARRFTQTRLGEKVGVSAEVIQKIEAGKTMQPRCIMELAEALGVNPAWLQVRGTVGKEGIANRAGLDGKRKARHQCGLSEDVT